MPTEQQDAMPDLKLPDWLPHVVRLAAETIYEREVRASSPDDINLLNCLSSDERMKSVWSELRKSKYKSTKTFVCPSDFYFISLAKSKRMKATELCQKGGDFNKATARLLEGQADVLDRQREQGQALWPEQECATYWFFHCAYYVAQDPRPLLSRAELKQERAAYSTAQQKLNELSETLRSLGMKSKAEELQRISVEVEDCASWVEVDARTATERRHRVPDSGRFQSRSAARSRVLPSGSSFAPVQQQFVVRMPTQSHDIGQIVEGAMDEMPWNLAAIQRGLQLGAAAIRQAAADDSVLIRVHVGDLAADETVATHQIIVPILQASRMDQASLRPFGLVR